MWLAHDRPSEVLPRQSSSVRSFRYANSCGGTWCRLARETPCVRPTLPLPDPGGRTGKAVARRPTWVIHFDAHVVLPPNPLYGYREGPPGRAFSGGPNPSRVLSPQHQRPRLLWQAPYSSSRAANAVSERSNETAPSQDCNTTAPCSTSSAARAGNCWTKARTDSRSAAGRA